MLDTRVHCHLRVIKFKALAGRMTTLFFLAERKNAAAMNTGRLKSALVRRDSGKAATKRCLYLHQFSFDIISTHVGKPWLFITGTSGTQEGGNEVTYSDRTLWTVLMSLTHPNCIANSLTSTFGLQRQLDQSVNGQLPLVHKDTLTSAQRICNIVSYIQHFLGSVTAQSKYKIQKHAGASLLDYNVEQH